MKNLHVARYITSELAKLQGDDLREKQVWLQELLDATDLQQQEMGLDGEASGTRRNNCLIVAGQDKSQAQASSPNLGRAEHSQSNRAPSKSGENHRTKHFGHHSRQPRDPAAVIASHVALPSLTQRNRHTAEPWRTPRRLLEPGVELKATSRPACM
jgi:hypothetical protein